MDFRHQPHILLSNFVWRQNMVLRLQKLQYDYTTFFLETFCLAAVSVLFLFFRLLRLLFLVIEHTVAEALEV